MKEKESTEIQTYDDGLSHDKHNALAERFNPFMGTVRGLVEQANGIEVKTVKDVEAMALARKTRLALREVRVGVEHARKELKESALREGKAVDGMANIIKFMIVPVEEELQRKEDFVREIEAARVAALVADRRDKLTVCEVDCEHFDLAAMTDAAFSALLSASELGYKAKKDAEAREMARIEAERVAEAKAAEDRRKAEAEERAKIEAENKKLRQEQEKAAAAQAKIEADLQKARAEAERVKKAADDAARRAAQEKADAERQAREDEIEALRLEKEASQARLAAPDADKLNLLATEICALTMPAVSSEVAMAAMQAVRSALNSAVKQIRAAVQELGKPVASVKKTTKKGQNQ